MAYCEVKRGGLDYHLMCVPESDTNVQWQKKHFQCDVDFFSFLGELFKTFVLFLYLL